MITRRKRKQRSSRKGVAALEEVMVLAIMMPLAAVMLFLTWHISNLSYQVIRAFVLSPVL